MRRRLDLPLVVAAGAALAAARPRWDGTPEDRVVAVGWAAAVVLWAWLVAVGAVHAWATRTGRARWRRLSGALLPSGVRRRVEQLAMAGLLVVPVAACADDGGATAAPVLVLEDAVPVETTTTWAPDPSDNTDPLADDVGATEAPLGEPSTTLAPPADGGATGTVVAEVGPSATAGPTTDGTANAGSDTPAPVTPPPGTFDADGGIDPDGPDPVDDPAFVVPVEPGTRVVLRGDHLWSIAAGEVAAATGRTPEREEVRRYWAALLDVNQATLASGDPDVIYPGEVLRLPAHQP